jgi:segregation and condensation protein A
MGLSIKLEIYEGPLDLLLHLIKKNEVDIYDIPIASITDQYLEYLKALEVFSIDVAGEFLLMAATLIQIKSRMLLPVLETDEETAEDPRLAIVRPLLEHMKLKDAAEILAGREILDRDVFSRTTSLGELGMAEEDQLVPVSLFELMDSFRRLLARLESSGSLEIVLDTRNIEDRIREIITQLKACIKAEFETLFAKDRSRSELILTFLALLELARVGVLRLFQDAATGRIHVFYLENRPPFIPLSGLDNVPVSDAVDPEAGDPENEDPVA